MKRFCVNCGQKTVPQPNANGFAFCVSCGCTNIIARPEDYEAATKVRRFLADGVNPSEKSTVEKVR